MTVAPCNGPPIAHDDLYIIEKQDLLWFDEVTVEQDRALQIDVLENDGAPAIGSLHISYVEPPWHGTVEVLRDAMAGDKILYTPNPGFCGQDQFAYRATSENEDTLTVYAPGLLQNDSDPDGDSIEPLLESQPSHGTLILNADGSFTYEPSEGFFGEDRFQYKVYDGEFYSEAATVTIIVEEPAQENVYVNVVCGALASVSVCEGEIIISEVAWGGTPADSEDEWIELRNLGEEPVDLTGWALRWREKGAEPPDAWTVVPLEGTISGSPSHLNPCLTDWFDYAAQHYQSPIRYVVGEAVSSEDPEKPFFLAERRHDETVSDVPSEYAGLVYHASSWPMEIPLSDEGAIIELVNTSGEVVDTANAYVADISSWPAGDRFGRTMERIDPLGPDEPWNWRTNEGIIAFHQDARKTPLFATSWNPNEPVIEWTMLPRWWMGQVSAIERGQLLPIPLPIPYSEALGGQLAVKVATTSELIDTSIVQMTEEHILIDTAELPRGEEYRVWVILRPGLTVFVPFKLG